MTHPLGKRTKHPLRSLVAAALLCGLAFAVTQVLAAPAALAAESHGEGEHGGSGHGDDGHGGVHDDDGHGTAGAQGHAAGPAKAEKIHNWFGFKDRDKYAPIGWAFVNFAILIFLLVKFAGKPFRSYLQERHESIKKQLDEAAELRAAAQKRLSEIEAKVKNLDAEIAGIKKAVADDAETEKQQIVAAAEREAERIVANTERTMAEEVKRAQRELEGEAVEAAMAAAEKLLKQRVNEGDHARINTEYLTGLTIGGGN